MKYTYQETTGGELIFAVGDKEEAGAGYSSGDSSWLTIIWNRGEAQTIIVDEVETILPAKAFLSLTASQTYKFRQPADLVSWEYNKDFYCIVDHDKEVSCSGFLFYGTHGPMIIMPKEEELKKFDLLVEVFKDEFQTTDSIQGEMLRMLLKRLIIKLTRLGKEQYLTIESSGSEYDILREFNLLVEYNFKKLHQVQDYANLLSKSPKTLSNIFSKYNKKSPLRIIQERIALEGKRLLRYTDKSSSEIGYELGFEEPAHFSRFFKKIVGESPTKFKQEFIAT